MLHIVFGISCIDMAGLIRAQTSAYMQVLRITGDDLFLTKIICYRQSAKAYDCRPEASSSVF